MYFLNLPTEGVSPGGWPMMLWMSEHFTNLINKKMGSWNQHSHHGKEVSPHHGLSTETVWRAQTLPPPGRNRGGISTESWGWKSRRDGSPALTVRTKEGQNQHRSRSKLRTEEMMGNYLCSAEANRRFLRMTSGPGTLKITLTDLPTERENLNL